MSAVTGDAPRPVNARPPFRVRWATLRATEMPQDRWASIGVLAIGALSAGAAAIVHFLL